MSLTFMGKKKGMTRLFNEKGDLVVCTVIAAEPHVVSQVKTKATDESLAVQLSAFKVPSSKLRNVTKPLKGHFAKAKIEPRYYVKESKIGANEAYEVGQEINVSYFNDCLFVDVTGMSKGKGFQGVIKRHHFAGGPASHGSGFHRHGGSTGMRTSPGRGLPGQKMPGRMGHEQVTMQNLKIVKIDEVNQLIIVEGAIPGARNGLVYVSRSKKKTKTNKK